MTATKYHSKRYENPCLSNMLIAQKLYSGQLRLMDLFERDLLWRIYRIPDAVVELTVLWTLPAEEVPLVCLAFAPRRSHGRGTRFRAWTSASSFSIGST